ncbi:sulfotransferase 1E1-like [Saccostrea echinata]|uniref:sulfotransferase 1E1-like n=1 Tax=Saccostrea echinata TaxID=191078 RepID=UPI002A80E1ED|nr:sulfotransferase 1E1-like [Saccostrea echinata]
MKNLLNDKGESFAKVLDYDGYYFPNFLSAKRDVDVSKFLAGLNELTFKDEEMCIVSYPKSGTHWAYEICNMLKNGNSEFMNSMLPIFENSPMTDIEAAQKKNGVHSSHMYPRHLPRDLVKKRCKIIQVYRNPKDVAVSYFNFSKKLIFYNTADMSFPEFLRHFVSGEVPCGGWVKWLQEWKTFQKENPDYPLLEISYEEMKRNLKEAVKRMSDFLNLNSSPKLIEEIARKCDFDIMSTYKNSTIPKEMSEITEKKNSNSHIFLQKRWCWRLEKLLYRG